MSELEIFIQFLHQIECRWNALSKSSNRDEKIWETAEFGELAQLTFNVFLDFRNVVYYSNNRIDEHKDKIRSAINLLKAKIPQNQSLENIINIDKWDPQIGHTLLSGKFIGFALKFASWEKKLRFENDATMQQRIESFTQLFLNNTKNDDTGQMVLNAFETYRKLLIRDTSFQNKLSGATIEKLIKNYMIILCHRKKIDHLSSVIKLYPSHRKLQYVNNVCETLLSSNQSTTDKACEIQIATSCIEDLLQMEFQKSTLHQNIKNYSLYIDQLLTLASFDQTIYDNMEKILLSVSNMKVVSDYYYLAATLIRLKMPNKPIEFVFKLISIGLSCDLSYLEEIKYSTSNCTAQKNSGMKSREEEYKLTFKRMYLALITLGCLIEDYDLRRMCFQAAHVCEIDTQYSEKILKFLPKCDFIHKYDSDYNSTFTDIRYQIETFKHEIENQVKLPKHFKTASNYGYEMLEFFNHRIILDENLKPLEYPGIERFLKRQSIEEKEHIAQSSDLDKCLKENDKFNTLLTSKFRSMKIKLAPLLQSFNPPSQIEVKSIIANILGTSDEIKIIKNIGIFTELVSISLEEMNNPYKHWQKIDETQRQKNLSNLLFDYNMMDEEISSDIEIDEIYQSGNVLVRNLYHKGYCSYDIENIMIYCIYEKKMKFISEEFTYLNKNKNIEDDMEQNQLHAAFMYVSNRHHPQYALHLKRNFVLKRYDNIMEFHLDFYVFDGAPGKYKYTPKNKINISIKQEYDSTDSSQENDKSCIHVHETSPCESPYFQRTQSQKSNDVPFDIKTIKLERTPILKKPKAEKLSGVETFNCSDEIKNVFRILQDELTALTNKQVTIDTSKMNDISSAHFIQSMDSIKSMFPIKIQKSRNGHVSSRDYSYEVKLPISSNGKIIIINEIKDEIKYDEFFEIPEIKSTSVHKIAGSITLEFLSHCIKFDLDCKIGDAQSKLKCCFRAPKPRKKPQYLQSPFSDKQTTDSIGTPGKVSVIQTTSGALATNETKFQSSNNVSSPSSTEMSTNANNIFESTPDKNSYETQLTSQYLPSFQSIMTSHYDNSSHPNQLHSYANNSISSPQYSFPPQPTTPVIQHSSSIQCSEINGYNDSQQSIVTNNVRIPKIEILKIENVPSTVNNVAKKLSFCNSNIPVIKNNSSNGHTINIQDAKVIMPDNEPSNNKSTVDELVDFEEEIQTTTLPLPNIRGLNFAGESRNFQLNTLLNSPPPLHYTNTAEKFKKDILIKTEPKHQEILQTTLTDNSHVKKHIVLSSPSSMHKLTSNMIMKKKISSDDEKEVNKATEDTTDDFIDLTVDNNEESVDLTRQCLPKTLKNIKLSDSLMDITFVSCESEPLKPENMPSSKMNINRDLLNKSKIRAVERKEMKSRCLKRSISPSDYSKNILHSKIRLIDVMKTIDKTYLKKNTSIRLKPVMHNNLTEFIAEDIPSEEEPVDNYTNYADDIYDTTFTIVCYNAVSYLLNDKLNDSIANIVNRYSKHKTHINPSNLARFSNSYNNCLKDHNIVNKFFELSSSYNTLNVVDQMNLTKVSYADQNPLNFIKNLKNQKKFMKWSPKENNNDICFDGVEIPKDEFKSNFNEQKNHESLLYQKSCNVLNSIPGINSFEFFKFPSKVRRALQIEVVHLKDIKISASSTSSSETSDVNDSASSEPGNLSNIETSSDDILPSNTTIHIQKIGQTSISHETETKPLQTSFGTIIKNTYPPATTRICGNDILKVFDKEKLLKDKKFPAAETSLKNNSNIKIIACSSHQIGDAARNTNKNQTLINMLTQQVVMPSNSNRHYIITSANKPPDFKIDSSGSGPPTTISQNQNVVRKVITCPSSSASTSQSQLVQILNSPPSNFTMKSLNMITTSNAPPTKPNQVVTVTSPASTTAIEGLKTDLPNSVKQQGIVQFICKTDGKIIHLTPICNNTAGGITKKITYKVDTSGAKGPTILHHANQQIILNNQLRKGENPNILTIIQKQSDGDKKNIGNANSNQKNTLVSMPQNNNPSSPINTRSIYEENYAKFIQTPSSSSATDILTISSSTPISSIHNSVSNTFIQKIGKTVIQSSNQILPKFNQAFGKSIFSSNTINDQVKTKANIHSKETFVRSVINSVTPQTKIVKNENKTEGSFINLLETDSIEKSLPTLQSALQGNNLLYARSIGNGKLIASNNNNVLLTALRNNTTQSNNVRIITSIADSLSTNNHNRATIMAPVRISVPIQIPQLINSVRPQTSGNFRPQIVIATTQQSIRPQTNIQNLTNHSGSKLESLLMATQSISGETCVENDSKIKAEQKTKKNVDNSTLEQLREFDMVLEQVLERSSATPNSSVSSPPPRPESRSSPRKLLSEGKNNKIEIKSSSTSVASNSPNDSPCSSKSMQGCSSSKTTPKLQEDEHTAQRILDILANYKEQVRNSPDLNNKPAPRRRANPPTNPPAKRKKMSSSTGSNMKNCKQFGSSSDVMTDTMGSEEDSSCGVESGVASTGSANNSPRGDIDDHTDVSMDNNFYMEDAKREIALSPQSSSSSVATSPAHNKFTLNRRLVMPESRNNSAFVDSGSSKSLIINSSQSSVSSSSSMTRTSSIGESIERLSAQGSTATAVLMPGNYILPMNVLKSGQQLAILSSNNGQKIIAVPTSQITSPVLNSNSGTSIILQRYVNQLKEGGGESKPIITRTIEPTGDQQKTIRLQSSQSMSLSNKIGTQNSTSTIYVKPIHHDVKNIKQENDKYNDNSSNNSFVSDKTLITEIIQQQQQLAHNHPQHNFMIKLNEPSNPRSSSSIMFMANTNADKTIDENIANIKSEKIEYDECIKEEIIEFQNENEHLNSPMLNMKMEVDDSTSSNHASDMDNSQAHKIPHYQSILSTCLAKHNSTVHQKSASTKGFLIDPSSKILMYNDRRQTVIDKEIFNPKSFSEECADLGVDEPIASDLFPEADLLLFDSGSPKFDQINPNDGNIQIKRELENGEVLLQMNYNHNITEPWLNFDTEDELVDDSHGESGDDIKDSTSLNATF